MQQSHTSESRTAEAANDKISPNHPHLGMMAARFSVLVVGILLHLCACGFLQDNVARFSNSPDGPQGNMLEGLTPKERLQYERFQQMVAWGFIAFKEYLRYFDSHPIPERVQTMLSEKTFGLISDTMTNPQRKFSGDEIIKLVGLADMYFAKDQALVAVVELAGKFVLHAEGKWPNDQMHGGIAFAIDNLIQNGRFSINIDDDEVVLAGLDVTPNTKPVALYALALASYFHPRLRIKSLPIDLEGAEIIQVAIQPHLTSVVFDNCSFNFSYEYAFNLIFQRW